MAAGALMERAGKVMSLRTGEPCVRERGPAWEQLPEQVPVHGGIAIDPMLYDEDDDDEASLEDGDVFADDDDIGGSEDFEEDDDEDLPEGEDGDRGDGDKDAEEDDDEDF